MIDGYFRNNVTLMAAASVEGVCFFYKSNRTIIKIFKLTDGVRKRYLSLLLTRLDY